LSSLVVFFTSDACVDNQLKNFNINTTAGADLTKHIGPSAEFIQMPVAYNYKQVPIYHDHNHALMPAIGSSKIISSNTLETAVRK
jgi:hypothetical protein